MFPRKATCPALMLLLLMFSNMAACEEESVQRPSSLYCWWTHMPKSCWAYEIAFYWGGCYPRPTTSQIKAYLFKYSHFPFGSDLKPSPKLRTDEPLELEECSSGWGRATWKMVGTASLSQAICLTKSVLSSLIESSSLECQAEVFHINSILVYGCDHTGRLGQLQSGFWPQWQGLSKW